MPSGGQRPIRAGGAHRLTRGLLALILLATASLTGCGGCGGQTPAQKAAQEQAERDKAIAEAKKRAEEEKKKKPFDIGRVTPLLSENLIEADGGISLRLTKPGHWTTTIQPMKANLADFDGRVTLAAVNPGGQILPLPHTPYKMTSSRPAVLAKERAKRIESELLVPSDAEKLNVSYELFSSTLGMAAPPTIEPWTLMPSHQYFMIVLAREPNRYAYLKVVDSIRAPFEDELGTNLPHYRVVLADGNKPLPLPSNVLTWTSVAYVVWDEVNIERMDPAQREALVDWIHWGGRLIINGPDSLDALRGSFLKDYLPVDVGDRKSFDDAALAEFSNHWSARSGGNSLKGIAVTKPWSGVTLTPRPGAVALPHAESLFYERGVGAGSIVVSAIQLGERDLVNWPGFDGFLNGALLRRPPREFRVENQNNAFVGLQSLWVGAHDRVRDAYFTTPMRWFARDAATMANAQVKTAGYDPNNQQSVQQWMQGSMIVEDQLVADRPGGLGEWNEFGPVAQAGRDALVEAAGVRVPGSSFVLICLGIYLVVLVPLNWMVFYALGRVEWAWISAPLIAIAGTLAVVRQAQLDIGFVRSQTEIALMELQGDLPRGHLTRYTAIYSSLSGTYDLEFQNSSAVATPFPRDNQWSPAIGDVLSTVAFEKYDQPRLRGLEVSSATTQMIHSEQMLPLDGPIRLYSPSNNPRLLQLENKSGFNLTDVAIVFREGSKSTAAPKRDSDAATVAEAERQSWRNLRGYWLGDLRDGAGTLLPPLTPLAVQEGELPYAAERAKAAELDPGKRLDVDPLYRMAFWFPPLDDPIHGRRDEYRLIGRINHVLPGAEVQPSASQTTGATVVLAHLRLGEAPFPAPDKNSPSDVKPPGRLNAYDGEPLPSDEQSGEAEAAD